MIQSKRNRASVVYDNKPDSPSQPCQPILPTSTTTDSLVSNKRGEDASIPKMGTVLDRLAMFQRK